MAQYVYKARDRNGALRSGQSSGVSATAVADELIRQGLTPVAIQEMPMHEEKGGAVPFSLASLLRRATKVSHYEILFFSRQMHGLIKAGVPILRTLAGLKASASPAMAAILAEIRKDLEAGRPLATAMARHKVFTGFYLAMVRVGEFTGYLEEVFRRLYHHLEFEQYMRQQVKSAIRYFLFVIDTMSLALAIINFFVIPAFARVYTGFKAELPWFTWMLVAVSQFTLEWWWVFLLLPLAAFFLFRAWIATSAGRHRWDRLKLFIPLAGPIIQKATLARFCRTLALGLKSGVPIVQALESVTVSGPVRLY